GGREDLTLVLPHRSHRLRCVHDDLITPCNEGDESRDGGTFLSAERIPHVPLRPNNMSELGNPPQTSPVFRREERPAAKHPGISLETKLDVTVSTAGGSTTTPDSPPLPEPVTPQRKQALQHVQTPNNSAFIKYSPDGVLIQSQSGVPFIRPAPETITTNQVMCGRRSALMGLIEERAAQHAAVVCEVIGVQTATSEGWLRRLRRREEHNVGAPRSL
ncbi:hypothetical protein KUCAC02_036283, partial [Chaenocephalus aceratus]